MTTKTTDKLSKAQEDMLNMIFYSLCFDSHTIIKYDCVSKKAVLKTTGLRPDGFMRFEPLHKTVFAALKARCLFRQVTDNSTFRCDYKLSPNGLSLCQELFDSGKTSWKD